VPRRDRSVHEEFALVLVPFRLQSDRCESEVFVGSDCSHVVRLHPEHETVGTVELREACCGVHECPEGPLAAIGGIDPHREERSCPSLTFATEGQHGETHISAVLADDDDLVILEALPPILAGEGSCFVEGRRERVRCIR
jgi:hypothetical protein